MLDLIQSRSYPSCSLLMTVLLGDSEKLQRMMDKFETACKRRALKVNVEKSKVMRETKNLGNDRLNIRLEGSKDEVDVFTYLGVGMSADGPVKDEMSHKIDKGKKWAVC